MDSLILFIFIFILSILVIFTRKNGFKSTYSNKTSQENYQHYARFYDSDAEYDSNFARKLNRIIQLVKYQKADDLKEIAGEVGCTLEEVILKINYLENSKILNNIHIDRKTYKIIECTPEDEKLIKKYTPYIYYNHYTLEEIATKVRRTVHYSKEEVEQDVFDELTYLINNDLVHGLKLDPVDRKIIYLAVDKNKTKHSKDLVTINCPRCGALNDINRGCKTRCLYCNSIIEHE